jgi:hypothetical protein
MKLKHRSLLVLGALVIATGALAYGQTPAPQSGPSDLLDVYKNATTTWVSTSFGYPRHHLTEYQRRPNQTEHATVVSSRWEFDEADRKKMEDVFGPDSVPKGSIIISRKYETPEIEWVFKFHFENGVKYLISKAGLSDFETGQIGSVDSLAKLTTVLAALEAPTTAQTALLEKVKGFSGGNMSGFAKNLIKAKLPRFMYFSHYDRMVGQIRIDNFATRQAAKPPQVETGELVFLDFLDYAGTSIEEIIKSTTYEGLNAKCEAASIRITEQLQEYWSQNPFLKIDVRVTKGESGDPAPFNEGIVARARVRNDLYGGMTVPFSERSAGFIWFFSFIVKFAQVSKDGGPLIILLDEPGLTLHGKAQGELLRYFDNEIVKSHQLLFTTHSPFMVPVENLPSVRIVEDRVFSPKPGKWASEGTKVRSDALAVDRDTLFPLQGALGYEITQALFVGKNTLLVEGPGDILFLNALSSALVRKGRKGLDNAWTLCPAGGLDKVQPFVSLFSSAKLNIAVLTDFAKSDKKKLENLRTSQILQGDNVLTFASLFGVDEADVEDVFAPELYAKMLNEAFAVPVENHVTVASLNAADANTTRLVKKAEAAFRVMPVSVPEFNHYAPAEWLITHPAVLDEETSESRDTLARAEMIFDAIRKIPVLAVPRS